MNEISLGSKDTGKDVVVDWEILDNFESNDKLFFDANGLEMQEKTLYKRKEYTLETDNTIASNYYPMT